MIVTESALHFCVHCEFEHRGPCEPRPDQPRERTAPYTVRLSVASWSTCLTALQRNANWLRERRDEGVDVEFWDREIAGNARAILELGTGDGT